ncbi:MAG TPA: PorV/PorQ family protein [Bacteroidales bacterium]|nr:PorV/PorQ family protein [Bacteroidales bacterium]
MNKTFKIFSAIILAGLFVLPIKNLNAGNEDRVGECGSQELLINPWARSSGWGGVGIACSRGIEAMYTNIAGMAFTQRTEIVFSHTIWLKGSGVNINTFGLSQKVGETSVIGVSFMAMSFGEIPITTVDLPEGGSGTYNPTLMNINISYAKMFSNSIYGGVNVKIINEKISNLAATGFAIDAGIQYITGEKENIMFGIALKNVGSKLKFKGDGLSISGNVLGGNTQLTVEQRSAEYELPTTLNIGAAYDFIINDQHKITLAGTFISNSFGKDQYAVGLEYKMMDYLYLRGGYVMEKGTFKKAERTNALTGPHAGITVQAPINKKKGSTIGVDYSYRATDPFKGVHSIGVRVNL